MGREIGNEFMSIDVKNCSSDLFESLFISRLARSRGIIWTVCLIWIISHTIIPFCLSFTFFCHVGLAMGTVFLLHDNRLVALKMDLYFVVKFKLWAAKSLISLCITSTGLSHFEK